jgi:hypothetical protein
MLPGCLAPTAGGRGGWGNLELAEQEGWGNMRLTRRVILTAVKRNLAEGANGL